MASVFTKVGSRPTCEEALVDVIGPTWLKFPKCFPCYFYAEAADYIFQVRKVGASFETGSLFINYYLGSMEAQISQILNSPGMMEKVFNDIPSESTEYIYDIRKGQLVTPEKFYRTVPPTEGLFLLQVVEDKRIVLGVPNSSPAIFAAGNYYANHIVGTGKETPTKIGKVAYFKLVANYYNMKNVDLEINRADLVDLPAGISGEEFYTAKSLTALLSLRKKLETQEGVSEQKISIMNIILAGLGIPKGLIDRSKSESKKKFLFTIDSMQDTIEYAYLENGTLFIKLIDSKPAPSLYNTIASTFKAPSIKYVQQ